jgi:hypothetical protein
MLRRLWLLAIALCAAAVCAGTAEHFQVGGQWCFVEAPAGKARSRAIVLIHGNGETVGPETSSWERNPGTRFLMDRLLEAGFLVAQSNATAVPSNGMWGNAGTQEAVLALMTYLRDNRGVTSFDALALSAGNVTLLNLALAGKARFFHAVLTAPVISLASLYRCPGGFDRVTQISGAFRFSPAHACPGDPRQDPEFLRRTQGYDPLRTIAEDSRALSKMAGTRFLACYEEDDPKVPPAENILALRDQFHQWKVPLRTWFLPGAATHGSKEMFEGCTPEIIKFLRQE